jgi:hypothetical protein
MPAYCALFQLATRRIELPRSANANLPPWNNANVFLGLLVLVLLCDPALLAAAEADESKRPPIALVLSGGGARGLAHVGVLQVLEDRRIPSTAGWAPAWARWWAGPIGRRRFEDDAQGLFRPRVASDCGPYRQLTLRSRNHSGCGAV